MSEKNHQVERCDQCGSPREEWQPAEENRCPRHAMPEPYSSCDGTLRPPQRDLSRVADWRPIPGLYRLFELGHVVAADCGGEYRFEITGCDSFGAVLIKVYVRTRPISGLESHR